MGVPSWKTASSRSFIVQTVKSSLDVMAVAIQGSRSPFSLRMNGVPKTWVENSLFPPPSRQGAIVPRIWPTEVTTCESCRSRAGIVGPGRGWTRPVSTVGVTAGAKGVGGSAAGCGRSGVSVGLRVLGVWAALAVAEGDTGSAARAAACGVGGSAGSPPPHPTARTTTAEMAANTRNSRGTLDLRIRFLISGTSSAWRRRRS